MIFYVIDFIVVLFLLHQVVVPVFRGLPIFPFFREKELTDELSELKQKVEEKKLDTQIKNVKRELKGKK